ncbi:Ferritin [Sarcoptes scabiei]|nr:Ferritin [Sarcoptes scabiei]
MRYLLFLNLFGIVFGTISSVVDLDSPSQSKSKRDVLVSIKNLNSYNLDETCLYELRKQMNLEKHANLVYRQMSFYFSSINVTRPGFSKFFAEQAKEEHEHFEKFINYIRIRGEDIDTFNITMPSKNKWINAADAIEDAIELEHTVTNEIMRLHRIADRSCKDVHLMNFLESEFIDEQIVSIHKLLKLAILLRTSGSEAYGEYQIDRDLFQGNLNLNDL